MLTDPLPSLDEVIGVLRVEHSKCNDERTKEGWKAFCQVFSADTYVSWILVKCVQVCKKGCTCGVDTVLLCLLVSVKCKCFNALRGKCQIIANFSEVMPLDYSHVRTCKKCKTAVGLLRENGSRCLSS